MNRTPASDPHAALVDPSAWVVRFAHLIPDGGRVLDVACGAGRHARFLASRGLHVEAVDRDAEALAALADIAQVRRVCADIEAGAWPFPGQRYAGIVVTNYLHRPLLRTLVGSLAEGGVLLYETFARGNERYGKPSNPDFLLEPGELLRAAAGLYVVAYENLLVTAPRPAVVQRLCAINAAGVPGATSQAASVKLSG
jgi:SAM-dependent methyltransferase